MKLIVFLCLFSSQLLAQEITTKVCTVFHDDKATNCLSKEKKDYPTSVVYGVSKMTKGAPAKDMKHFWNGVPGEVLTSFSGNRIVVSAFNLPPDYNGELTFSVRDATDQLVSEVTYVIARGPLAITAQEKSAVVENTPAQVQASATPAPAQKMEMDEMFIPTPHAAPAANASAQKALDAAPVKDSPVPRVQKESERSSPHEKSEARVAMPTRRETAQNEWLRFEVHGAYVTQKDAGEAGTAIGYWAPELRFSRAFGMGARVGGTQWKQKDDDRFTAFESDLHLSFILDSSAGLLTFQPLVGYHAWGDLGSQFSYGGNLVLRQANSAVSYVLGAQAWKHDDVSYTWVNAGIGISL